MESILGLLQTLKIPSRFYCICCGRDQHLGGRRGSSHLQRQQGRHQETHGGPGQGRRRGRTGDQENQTGVSRTGPCACRKKGGGKGTAIADAAPTLPAAARSGYLVSCRRPTVGLEPATKTLPTGGEDRRGAARAAATEGPFVATEAAHGRPARPLGPLVTYGEDSEQTKKMSES